MRFLCLFAAMLLAAGSATAASITITPVTDNTTCGGLSGSCTGNGGTDWGSSWNTSAGAAGTLGVGVIGSTSTTMAVNAMTAIDGGGDATARLFFNHTYTITITTDTPITVWDVDLGASILGITAFRGDGGATAVGNQDDGTASISTVATTIDSNIYNIGGASRTVDCSNTCQNQAQFSNSLSAANVLTGVGSATFNVTVDFDLAATTNDGCSGTVCSSISGGEEAGILFGTQDSMDQAVDNYGTWGRSIGPDGYNSTWTLNVSFVPEPATGALVMIGLAGMSAYSRRLKRG